MLMENQIEKKMNHVPNQKLTNVWIPIMDSGKGNQY